MERGAKMEIVDLSEEHLQTYSVCLEDWSEEAKEGAPRKKLWYDKMKNEGLRVKLALGDNGVVGGMIQYIPIEHSAADGRDLFFVQCIWVHGYEQGRGDFQKKGMGKALLAAAEEDVRARGAKGLAAWGIWPPFWMKASWFKKQGYRKVDRQGIAVLLWKPFYEDAIPPRWFKSKKKRPEKTPGKVTVASFVNGWCMSQNLVCERAKRASAEFGAKVAYREIDTSDRKTFLEWGISDALFIDGKQVRTGPPPSYETICELIAKRIKKLQ